VSPSFQCKYSNYSLVGCDAISYCGWIPTWYWLNIETKNSNNRFHVANLNIGQLKLGYRRLWHFCILN
jgi:hypothetical protein